MDIQYFMDVCTDWELNDIVDNILSLDRNLWESSRLIAYVMAQVNSKKKLTFKDICSFKWEEIKHEPQVDISNDDINRLKELSRKWEGHA
jgi:hypothetical protein